MSKSVITHYGNRKTVLKFNDFVATTVTVSDEGIVAIEGKKIIPAGTIVGGKSAKVLQSPNEPVVAKNTADAEGVLFNDVDVTYGPAAGSMIIHGFIDLTKLPAPPDAAAVAALKQITFMN